MNRVCKTLGLHERDKGNQTYVSLKRARIHLFKNIVMYTEPLMQEILKIAGQIFFLSGTLKGSS